MSNFLWDQLKQCCACSVSSSLLSGHFTIQSHQLLSQLISSCRIVLDCVFTVGRWQGWSAWVHFQVPATWPQPSVPAVTESACRIPHCKLSFFTLLDTFKNDCITLLTVNCICDYVWVDDNSNNRPKTRLKKKKKWRKKFGYTGTLCRRTHTHTHTHTHTSMHIYTHTVRLCLSQPLFLVSW